MSQLSTDTGGRSISNAGQACRECRRRKGRCDAKIPVCSVCLRYNRHCLYDKHSRSALTRKHLTEVEERLEKAEALLRTIFSEPELARVLAGGLRNEQPSQPVADVLTSPADAQNPPSLQRSNTDVDSTFASPPAEGSTYSQTQRFDYFTSAHPDSRAPNDEHNSALHDNVPSAADDDFEWDEREEKWSSFAPGDSQVPDSAALRKITDGMATLTANDTNTGFLGAVSGAALLRLISVNRGPNQRGRDVLEMGDERRSSIVDLLEQQITASASDSWLAAQPILNRAFVDSLIDTYFVHYHPTFPILHEPTFREHYNTLHDRPKGIWHTLANLVAALGAFVSDRCPDMTDINLFNSMKSQLTIESLETGSLGLVQAFAMAANYLQKRNRPNSGYNYGGVALRLAISLGLHKEFSGWQTALVKKEIRRRVWWSLCVLDVGATITYGRPLNWPHAGVEARFPLNIKENDLTINSTSLPSEISEATMYSYVRTQSEYHLSTIQIYNRLITSPLPSASELTTLDDILIEKWRCNLPSYYSDNILSLADEHKLGHSISRCRFRIMRIIMYRPFLLRWAQDGFAPLQTSRPEDSAVNRCLVAAEECISVLTGFWKSTTHTRLSSWYVLYFLLQAVLIPVHCVRRESFHSEAGNWIQQVRDTLSVINAMVDINPSALKCRDIIIRLCGKSLVQATPYQNHSNTDLPSMDPFIIDGSNLDWENSSVNSWMKEVDSAVDGYNTYCDLLTNTMVPDIVGMNSANGLHQDDSNVGSFNTSHIGVGSEPGGQNWDWVFNVIQ